MTRSRFPGRNRNPCRGKGHYSASECPINIVFHFQLHRNCSGVQKADKKSVDNVMRTKILEEEHRQNRYNKNSAGSSRDLKLPGPVNDWLRNN